MKIGHFIFVIILLVTTGPVLASSEPCEEQLWTQNKITAHSFWYKSTQGCVAKVSPNFSAQRWRSYSVFEHGVFVVFNSFNNGGDITSTASRSYILFPRVRAPRLVKQEDEVILHSSDGKEYRFSDHTQRLLSIEGAKFVDTEIDPNNEGGFKLTHYDGLILDMGFQFGEMGSANPNRSSTFKDRYNRECIQLNAVIFDYEYAYSSSGEKYLKSVHFKFSDQELKVFIQNVCPYLDLNF